MKNIFYILIILLITLLFCFIIKPKISLPIIPVLPILKQKIHHEPIIIHPTEVKTYKEAINLAKMSKSNIFIFFSASWCNYCEKMNNYTFKDENVKNKLKSFVILKINIDENNNLNNKFNISGIPDYMIINENEKIIKRTTGFKSPEEFINWIN